MSRKLELVGKSISKGVAIELKARDNAVSANAWNEFDQLGPSVLVVF